MKKIKKGTKEFYTQMEQCYVNMDMRSWDFSSNYKKKEAYSARPLINVSTNRCIGQWIYAKNKDKEEIYLRIN